MINIFDQTSALGSSFLGIKDLLFSIPWGRRRRKINYKAFVAKLEGNWGCEWRGGASEGEKKQIEGYWRFWVGGGGDV